MGQMRIGQATVNIYIYTHITGGWWHLNWGSRDHGNGWSETSRVESNTIHSILSIPDIISCAPLSSFL